MRLLAAKAAGYDYVLLDGTLIETDRIATPGPTFGVDLWWSKKHTHPGLLAMLAEIRNDVRTLADLGYEAKQAPSPSRSRRQERAVHRHSAAVQPSPQPAPRGRRTREQPTQDDIQSPAQRDPLPVEDRGHRRRAVVILHIEHKRST